MTSVYIRPEGLSRWTERPPVSLQAIAAVSGVGGADLAAMTSARWFSRGLLSVCVNVEPHLPGGKPGYHMSISHPARYPDWEEIKRARYDLLPHDIWMVQVLPPPSEYVSHHPNCFHLWESEECRHA